MAAETKECPYFIQIGNGSKRPYRLCARTGSMGWMVLSTYKTQERAEKVLARLSAKSEAR